MPRKACLRWAGPHQLLRNVPKLLALLGRSVCIAAGVAQFSSRPGMASRVGEGVHGRVRHNMPKRSAHLSRASLEPAVITPACRQALCPAGLPPSALHGVQRSSAASRSRALLGGQAQPSRLHDAFHTKVKTVCLLLQYLIQSCAHARGGRRIVEDMCYEIRRAEACVD
jgi:hypothetical protein